MDVEYSSKRSAKRKVEFKIETNCGQFSDNGRFYNTLMSDTIMFL